MENKKFHYEIASLMFLKFQLHVMKKPLIPLINSPIIFCTVNTFDRIIFYNFFASRKSSISKWVRRFHFGPTPINLRTCTRVREESASLRRSRWSKSNPTSSAKNLDQITSTISFFSRNCSYCSVLVWISSVHGRSRQDPPVIFRSDINLICRAVHSGATRARR